ETKGRKMNKIKREERENLHTFSDTTMVRLRLRLFALFGYQVRKIQTTNQYSTGIIWTFRTR
ncbi:hypothetical protein, partial [uncultured Prevotella sp.]|uniref:hypothetical protein n=1 Tax=uncultured Prevotella sp. TaxID=159272 RepID=UPI002587D1BA